MLVLPLSFEAPFNCLRLIVLIPFVTTNTPWEQELPCSFIFFEEREHLTNFHFNL